MAAVSVIIPAYNAASYLVGALESVLVQTMQDFEIVVVDDGSKDSTAAVLKPYLADPRIHYLHQENRGLPGARNSGAKASTGKYLAFLDADDFLAPTALETMYRKFEESGAAWSIVGVLKLLGSEKIVRRVRIPEGDLLWAILDEDFVTRCPFYERREFFAIGMYDEAVKMREDWDINIRLIAARRPFVVIDEPLYLYSRSEGSITTGNYRKLFAYTEQVLRKHHKRLADEGNKKAAQLYARNMWEMARRYGYELGDYAQAFRCVWESMRYDLSLGRLLHPVIHRIEVAVDRR